jgi:hypothetical protein
VVFSFAGQRRVSLLVVEYNKTLAHILMIGNCTRNWTHPWNGS